MTAILYILLSFILGFSLVYISIPAIIKAAKEKHLYDEPNERTATKKIVPTLGGISIFIGITLSTIIASDGYRFSSLKYVIAAVITLFFLGLKDDILTLSVTKKLLTQVFASSLLIVLGNIRFTNLHGILGIYEINYIVSFVISLFAMLLIINAFNLIDGIDGLASGVGILASSLMGGWFCLSGYYEYAIMCFAVTGSLIAFFIYNVFGKTNKIFMGDTGSLILGITIAVAIIQFNEFNIDQHTPYAVASAPVLSVGILIMPLMDTLRVFILRLLQKKSPFLPDMNHIHHNLLRLGNSHLHTTCIILGVNILFILMAFSIQHMYIHFQLIAILGLGLVTACLPSLILRRKNNLSKTTRYKIWFSPNLNNGNISQNKDHKKVDLYRSETQNPLSQEEVREEKILL
jgi:UDP-GlcNAc:undecaprenyl-phosphate GlcNAc-1-phosphate transferase